MIPAFKGEFFIGDDKKSKTVRQIYATDASVYQELPMAVAIPKDENDIKLLIAFAEQNNTYLIPRAAGTSLAGQVVGNGIVVDISVHFTKILELNVAEKWVRVQPGVIRDDLNAYLKPFGLMFGPETSTASRAMIGGMIGNNSSGLHSVVWGDTRSNLLGLETFLANGERLKLSAVGGQLSVINNSQSEIPNPQSEIVKSLFDLVEKNQELIKKNFPKASVKRRNTGYALDCLVSPPTPPQVSPHRGDGRGVTPLIAGSEGTLCFITEATLKLIDLPPPQVAVVAVHTKTIREALFVNLIALKHACYASELVDDFILQFTKGHPEYQKNRIFIDGEPKAILMVEFFANQIEELNVILHNFITELKNQELGYAYPILFGEDTKIAWDVRKAGLGLLRNLKGDTQAVNLIEDCAVSPQDLPDYIEELEKLLKKHNLQYSMYAHAGAGELHVEPMINLKTETGRQLFRTILAETAILVKKYGGSLSGEHGDGRLRGEFIPFMMGEDVYQLFREVKHIFDPKGIFNRGKIVDTPPMNEFLRYQQDQPKPIFNTIFDFSENESILRLAEKCSGSGDCRKTEITGGTMCPSYMATRQEKDTTRARANMLRSYYTAPPQPFPEERELMIKIKGKAVPPPSEGVRGRLQIENVKDVLDLCLSCKACKTECPSGVDVTKMKAEFMQNYYDENGVPFRSWLIGNFSKLMRLASYAPAIYNYIYTSPRLRKIANKIVGFHPDRTMPLLSRKSLVVSRKIQDTHLSSLISHLSSQKIQLFIDEFSQYNDGHLVEKAIDLLNNLGYEVTIPKHIESGRAYLSKGLLRDAQKIAIRNVELLKDIVSEQNPLIGIEPSAILTFRDEYPNLVPEHLKAAAAEIAKNTFLFEEWFCKELDKGAIKESQFTDKKQLIKLHGHCHQKALASLTPTKKMLSLPKNFQVQLIPSGCCGMAGSFGYEKEHYEISMKVGELVLFPIIRQQNEEVLIAASGTSCRHQIKDGTSRIAQHPIEIMWDSLSSPMSKSS